MPVIWYRRFHRVQTPFFWIPLILREEVRGRIGRHWIDELDRLVLDSRGWGVERFCQRFCQ
ncbi:MAG TPA: hypothetical protein DIC23_13660, partial [Planctomycetaceae bacterium]|nr:hypothetical protein [Planctomycetaceae bacterium]